MQKTNTKDMTSGSPVKLLLFFAVPLMLGNLFQQMYTMVDTIIVGKGVGVEALASLGAADWLNWLFLGLVTGLTQGFSIQMAQLYGAGQMERLKQTIGTAVLLTVGAAVLFVLVGQGGLRFFLDLMHTPDNIYAGAEIYLRIMFGGIPVILAYNLSASMLRALGDGKTPLYAMVIAACINVVLDLVFVMVFHWGIPGAAAGHCDRAGVFFSVLFFGDPEDGGAEHPQSRSADGPGDRITASDARYAGDVSEYHHQCRRNGGTVRDQWIRISFCGRLYGHQQTVWSAGNGGDLVWLCGHDLHGSESRRRTAGPYPDGNAQRDGDGGGDFCGGVRSDADIRTGDPAAVCVGGSGSDGRGCGDCLSLSVGDELFSGDPVCAARIPLRTAGAGRYGDADGVRSRGVRDACQRRAASADGHRTERCVLCGDSGVDRSGGDPDHGLLQKNAPADRWTENPYSGTEQRRRNIKENR